jgi:hypothetical protein
MVVETDATATASSFAVGRFATAKGMDETYLSVVLQQDANIKKSE